MIQRVPVILFPLHYYRHVPGTLDWSTDRSIATGNKSRIENCKTFLLLIASYVMGKPYIKCNALSQMPCID